MVKIENQVLIGIVVTLLGWLVQQRFRLAGAQRQEQLARVNEQLRELYVHERFDELKRQQARLLGHS